MTGSIAAPIENRALLGKGRDEEREDDVSRDWEGKDMLRNRRRVRVCADDWKTELGTGRDIKGTEVCRNIREAEVKA